MLTHYQLVPKSLKYLRSRNGVEHIFCKFETILLGPLCVILLMSFGITTPDSSSILEILLCMTSSYHCICISSSLSSTTNFVRYGTRHMNSLWHSDVVWWHRSGSILALEIVCCLTAPRHYLNQCQLLMSEVHWHSPECDFTASGLATIL